MTIDLNNRNDNLVLIDDVVVQYEPGFREADAEDIASAQARSVIRSDIKKTDEAIASVSERTTTLTSRANSLADDQKAQGNAISGLQSTSKAQGDDLESLQEDYKMLTGRVTDNENGRAANASAIEKTTALADKNASDIQATSGRLSDYQVSIGALNLVTPPGETPNAKTSTYVNARATEEVKAGVKENDGKLTAYGTRLNALDASYQDQQKQIDSKASNSQLQTVEANADSARSTLQANLKADYNGQIASINQDLETKATKDGVSSLYTLRVSGKTRSGDPVIGGFGLGSDGHTSRAIFNVDEFALGYPDKNDVYPFVYSGDRVVMQEALIERVDFGKLVAGDGQVAVGNGKIKSEYLEVSEARSQAETSTGDPLWEFRPDGTFAMKSKDSAGGSMKFDGRRMEARDSSGRLVAAFGYIGDL